MGGGDHPRDGNGRQIAILQRDRRLEEGFRWRGLDVRRFNQSTSTAGVDRAQPRTAPTDGVVLTVSGYIVEDRERIELSPRFMGQVRWIGVKKGDPVTNGQVVVLLDDTEYQANKQEIAGRLTRRAFRCSEPSWS